MKDYFVSYNGQDKAWAEWIAWTLEEAQYSVLIQAWDFRPGENFVLEMQKATMETQATALVLSQHFLDATYTQPEWAAAFVQDPTGDQRKLIPFRVGVCKPGGLLKALIYADLVGLGEAEAKVVVLEALKERLKPEAPPLFPGIDYNITKLDSPPRVIEPRFSTPQAFPGKASAAVSVWQEKLEFLRLQEPVLVDAAQKFAVKKQIEEAEYKIRELGG